MKIRIISNSGWTFMYVDGLLYEKGMFVKAGWTLSILNCLGLIKDIEKYKEFFFDPYHAPHASDIDNFLEEDDINIKSFSFANDDYYFTPFEVFQLVDPKAKMKFKEVVEYLLNDYKYKDKEKNEILNFIK
jgi:hypothetical protein